MLTQGLFAIEVKNAPSDYPAQGSAKDFSFGAEYMVNSFSAQGRSFTVEDYLIVEIGLFPKGEANVDLRRFTLRVNGKALLLAQTPGMVAASLKYPDWNSKPVVTAARRACDFGTAAGGGAISRRPARPASDSRPGSGRPGAENRLWRTRQ